MDEIYYTDNNLRDGEPNLADRQVALERRVRRLRNLKQELVASCMEDCAPYERCNLAICPHCSAAFQRTMLEQVPRVWADKGLMKVTWVLAEARTPLGELSRRTPASLQRMFRRNLERAAVAHHPCIGFIDLSVNVHSENAWDPHWQPHMELIMPTESWEKVRPSLLGEATRDIIVQRPLRGVSINDTERQVSYAFKPDPGRKTFFDTYSSKAFPTKQRITAKQENEFLLWLAGNPPDVRRFMIGVRSYGGCLRLLNGGTKGNIPPFPPFPPKSHALSKRA